MVEEIIDAGVCMYGYIFISCMQKKKKSAYEQWNWNVHINLIFQEMPGLALPMKPYYTSQYTNIMINISYVITYLLHISLPPVIIKNNTQDVKQYCVVSNGTVCSSCLGLKARRIRTV